MTMSIAEELRETFHLAILRREAKVLLTGRQWGTTGSLGVTLSEGKEQGKSIVQRAV